MTRILHTDTATVALRGHHTPLTPAAVSNSSPEAATTKQNKIRGKNPPMKPFAKGGFSRQKAPLHTLSIVDPIKVLIKVVVE